jgi:hypothetical protein
MSSFFLFFGFFLFTTCFVLCSSLSIAPPSSSSSPPPFPPVLSNTFVDPNVVIYDAAQLFFNFDCYIAQYEDPNNSNDLYSYLDSFGKLYGRLANETQLTLPQLNSSAAYLTLNGICRVEPSANLIPSFSLLSLTFQGFENITQTFQNNRTVECEVWNTPNNTLTFYILPSSSSSSSSSSGSSSPDIIVRISINPSNISGLGFAYLLDFSPNFQPNPPSLSPSSPVFQIPSQCTSNHLCPQGPVIPLEGNIHKSSLLFFFLFFFRFHFLFFMSSPCSCFAFSSFSFRPSFPVLRFLPLFPSLQLSRSVLLLAQQHQRCRSDG